MSLKNLNSSNALRLIRLVCSWATVQLILVGCGGGGGSEPATDSGPVTASFTSILHRGSVPSPRSLKSGAFWSVSGGVITKDGEPTFPIGIYYVSHFADGRRQRLADTADIATAGFSIIHTPIRLDDRDFLDTAAAQGLSVAVEFNENPQSLVAAFRDHPAVSAFSSFDDVDSPRTNVSPDQARASRAQLEADAPSQLTMVSAAFPGRVASYRDAASLVGFQLYPIPHRAVSSVYGSGSAVSGAVTTGNSVYVPIVQAFNQDHSRLPSDAELRSMTWQALLGGDPKGIFFYTFYDGANYVKANPSFWSSLRGVAQDLSRRAPYMAGAESQMMVTNNAAVIAKVFRKSGTLLLAIANLSGAEVEYTVDVPTSSGGKPIAGKLGPLGIEALIAAD